MTSLLPETSLLPTVFPVALPENLKSSPPSSTPTKSAVLERYEEIRDANQERGSYDPENALDELQDCKLAMDLFLSRMIESEELLLEGDPKMEKLYIATDHALIEAVKALMSFEDKVGKSTSIASIRG